MKTDGIIALKAVDFSMWRVNRASKVTIGILLAPSQINVD
jgi:hypothetical protein